jgi:hypothetical protein
MPRLGRYRRIAAALAALLLVASLGGCVFPERDTIVEHDHWAPAPWGPHYGWGGPGRWGR